MKKQIAGKSSKKYNTSRQYGRAILIAFVLMLFCTTLFAATQATPTPSSAPAVSSSKTVTQTSLFQKIADGFNSLPQTIFETIFIAVFSIFVYLCSVLANLFDLMFQFITKFIFLLIDFSNMSIYPSNFAKIVAQVRTLVYVVSIGFLFLIFITSIVSGLWRGDDISKPLLGLVFAAVLLAAYPLIYGQLYKVFFVISERMQTIVGGAKEQHSTIFNSLVNISSFMGNVSEKGLTITGLINQQDQNFKDVWEICLVVKDRVTSKDYGFFINYLLMFIAIVAGIIAMFEVIVLKGAQILNLFIAFFTGIFAASLVATEGLRDTFWQWLKNVAQFFSYNFFWGLIIIALNLFASMLDAESGSAWKMLYLVAIFAGLKLMSKVGGIAEGLAMSRHVMENFASGMKMDAALAGFAAKTALGGAVAGGIAMGTGAISMGQGAHTLANAGARTINDFGGIGNIASKVKNGLDALEGGDVRGSKSIREIGSAFNANASEVRHEKFLSGEIASGRRAPNNMTQYHDEKYDQNMGKTLSGIKKPKA